MKKAPTTFHGAGAGEQLSFLPPPPFCPWWTTRGILADKALKLMDGHHIDHPEFDSSTQSWRLGVVIFTLRALGWPVETIEVVSPTSHCPDGTIARYKLDVRAAAHWLVEGA